MRIAASRLLFVLALPFVFLGLIDPLEGGLALLLALVIYIVAFLLAGYGPSRSLWIPYLLSFLIGGTGLLLAIFGIDRVDNEPNLLPLAVFNWLYRAAVIATLVGAILTVIKSFRTNAS